MWAPLVLHSQENSVSSSALSFPAHGTCSGLPSSSPTLWGWEMLPIFSSEQLPLTLHADSRPSIPQKSPFESTIVVDLIPSSSFLPHNPQHALGMLYYFLVAMPHTWSHVYLCLCVYTTLQNCEFLNNREYIYSKAFMSQVKSKKKRLHFQGK